MRKIVEVDVPYKKQFEKKEYDLRLSFRDNKDAIEKAKKLREEGYLVRQTKEKCKVYGKDKQWTMLWLREK